MIIDSIESASMSSSVFPSSHRASHRDDETPESTVARVRACLAARRHQRDTCTGTVAASLPLEGTASRRHELMPHEALGKAPTAFSLAPPLSLIPENERRVGGAPWLVKCSNTVESHRRRRPGSSTVVLQGECGGYEPRESVSPSSSFPCRSVSLSLSIPPSPAPALFVPRASGHQTASPSTSPSSLQPTSQQDCWSAQIPSSHERGSWTSLPFGADATAVVVPAAPKRPSTAAISEHGSSRSVTTHSHNGLQLRRPSQANGRRGSSSASRRASEVVAPVPAEFNRTLATAMISTGERMMESERRRSSTSKPLQPSSSASRGNDVHASRRADSQCVKSSTGDFDGNDNEAETLTCEDSLRSGAPTTPITMRAMLALHHHDLEAAPPSGAPGSCGVSIESLQIPHTPTSFQTGERAASSRVLDAVHPSAVALPPPAPAAASVRLQASERGTSRRDSLSLQSLPSYKARAAHGEKMRGPSLSNSNASTGFPLPCTPRPPVHGRQTPRGGASISSDRENNVAIANAATTTVGAREGEASNEKAAPQLSHHQLTEAFYASYQGERMARDAYLYFVSQQAASGGGSPHPSNTSKVRRRSSAVSGDERTQRERSKGSQSIKLPAPIARRASAPASFVPPAVASLAPAATPTSTTRAITVCPPSRRPKPPPRCFTDASPRMHIGDCAALHHADGTDVNDSVDLSAWRAVYTDRRDDELSSQRGKLHNRGQELLNDTSSPPSCAKGAGAQSSFAAATHCSSPPALSSTTRRIAESDDNDAIDTTCSSETESRCPRVHSSTDPNSTTPLQPPSTSGTASTPRAFMQPVKENVRVGVEETDSTAARIEALLRMSTSVYNEAKRQRHQKRPKNAGP